MWFVRFAIVGVVLGVAVAACTADDPTPGSSSTSVTVAAGDPTGEWVLVEPLRVVEGRVAYLEVGSSSVSGVAFCNEFAADVAVGSDGGWSIVEVVSTAVGCRPAQNEAEATVRDGLVSATSYALVDGRLVLSGPDGDLVFEALDRSVVDEWDDAEVVEVGALVVAVPSDAQRLVADAAGTVRGLDDQGEVRIGFLDECRRRTVDVRGRDVLGIDMGCAGLFWWAFEWDQPPSVGDQGSELVWSREVAEHACLDDTLAVDLPAPPTLDEWVADGGIWVAEADLPFVDIDVIPDPDPDSVVGSTREGDERVAPLVADCQAANELVFPLPTRESEAPVSDTESVVGDLAFDGTCFHLVDGAGTRWLAVWPPGHELLLFPQPGRVLFEVFDRAGFDVDPVGDGPFPHTFLAPTTFAELFGTADVGADVDTLGCDGTPFAVAQAATTPETGA